MYNNRFNNRNFNAKPRFNKRNSFRSNKPNLTKVPQNVLDVYNFLKSNADFRRYASFVIQALLKENGTIPKDHVVWVKFDEEVKPGIYQVGHYKRTENSTHPLATVTDYPYTTKEFYTAMMAVPNILIRMIANNLSIYYTNNEPEFDLDKDVKALNDIAEKAAQSIVDEEVLKVAARARDAAKAAMESED